ncbi:MAG: rhamnose transport system permease protein [Chthoniobacter sp.]|jgi:ribose/xylose/arabinose/galactoside ABC-type transport system permease subunit|nr:rhamnose transport system permease protein [Chthoniobacter sp.]
MNPLTLLARRREYAVALALALTIAVAGIVNPAFLAAGNLRDILVQVVPAAIVGCGLTFVIVTGEIDISVGSSMGLLAAVLGQLCSPLHAGLPVWVAVVLTLLAGTLIGLVNGLLVTVARVPSIIVTLGMLTALRGATEMLMAGKWITDLPSALRFLGTGSVLGMRVSLWMAALVIVTSILFARNTALGRRVYAVGSNPHAAHLAGLSVGRIKIFVFTLTGFLVGVATLVSVPQLSVIESGIGIGLELLVVTCVVVGGTSISGGKGTIIGTILGVGLLGIVRTVLIFLNLGERSVYWERAIQGGFILAAVLADNFAQKNKRGEAHA